MSPPLQSWFSLSNLPLLSVLLLFPLLFLLLLTTNSKKSRLPPSPPRIPFIGNLHQLGPLPHRSLHSLSEKHGPLMLLHLGQVPTLVVSSADTAEQILRTHDPIFANRPLLVAARILLYETKTMSFAPLGEHWRQVRKLCVTHLLSAKLVQSFRLVREEEVAFMVAKICRSSSSAAAGGVDVSEVLNSFSNDIVCRVVSGKFSREGGRNGLFRELILENITLLGGFHVADYFPMLGWLDMFFGLSARATRNRERWDAVLDDILKEHADRWKDDGHKSTDFVDALLSFQEDPNNDFVLTKDHIKALLVDMLAAGTDTTYIVLEWAMAELMKNPEAMKKLRDEVRGMANGKAIVGEDDLREMSYLRAVLKEVLRLHPPAPLLIPRESTEKCQIEGYEVPKKTRVIVNAWAISRDPKYWEEPEEFRPERFLTSSTDFKGMDFQFIPFGAGRRICPGMNFAIPALELALVNLIHGFDWELPGGTTRGDLDMADSPGLTTRKKQRLCLVAKPCSS